MWLDFFRIDYIPQKVINKIRDKSITHNIFRIQDNDFAMCGLNICFHEKLFYVILIYVLLMTIKRVTK